MMNAHLCYKLLEGRTSILRLVIGNDSVWAYESGDNVFLEGFNDCAGYGSSNCSTMCPFSETVLEN